MCPKSLEYALTIWLSFMVELCEMMISPGVLGSHTSYDCHLWYTCVIWWYLQVFFFLHFFQISFFGLLGGQRGKMTQNDKKLCSLCLISQELYIIWSSFMVHISCLFFTFFQNFNFHIQLWVKREKKKKKKKGSK